MDTTIYDKLLPGEEILWEGQSQSTSGYDLQKNGTSLFGIIWLGFSLFWTVSAFLITRGDSSIGATLFPLFGLPFIIVGIVFVVVVPRQMTNRRKNTFYYVTNKRIIISINTEKSPAFNSVFISDLAGMQLVENRDNTGNIIFKSYFISTDSSNAQSNVPSAENCFYRIENANDVHKLILLHQQLSNTKENI